MKAITTYFQFKLINKKYYYAVIDVSLQLPPLNKFRPSKYLIYLIEMYYRA